VSGSPSWRAAPRVKGPASTRHGNALLAQLYFERVSARAPPRPCPRRDGRSNLSSHLWPRPHSAWVRAMEAGRCTRSPDAAGVFRM